MSCDPRPSSCDPRPTLCDPRPPRHVTSDLHHVILKPHHVTPNPQCVNFGPTGHPDPGLSLPVVLTLAVGRRAEVELTGEGLGC